MSVPAAVESRIADAPLSAHLATAVDDRPHVAPIWYGYRDGVLYFITGGQKLANVRRNDRVALSIESAEAGAVAWNVTLLGRATVVEDPERIEWAEGWIYDRYGGLDEDESPDDEGEMTGSAEEPAADGDEAMAESDGDAAGEAADPEWEYALVEVEIGSTALSVYD